MQTKLGSAEFPRSESNRQAIAINSEWPYFHTALAGIAVVGLSFFKKGEEQ
jgi:hypothetical protein